MSNRDDQTSPDGQQEGATPPLREESGAAGGDQLENELVATQKQLADIESRLLRVSADYQNFVRRSQQNIVDAQDQQLMSIAKALISVLDHFDLAVTVDPEKTPVQSVLQGVQMVRSELLTVLERFGIRRVEVNPGDEFDPEHHQALMQGPAEGIEANRIAQQLQPGYVLGEKIIRPVQVKVAQ